MKEAVNIICLYWVGEFRGRDFSIDDVDRLHQTVSKHIDRPFMFYVLTNAKEQVPEYYNIIELQYDWPGWWAKVELHRPDLADLLEHPKTLYMDLDSHCIRSLAPILDFEGDGLTMFPPSIPEDKWNREFKRLVRDGWVRGYQAATMLFTAGCHPMRLVWESFLSNPNAWMKEQGGRYRSEQDVMADWIPDLATFPREWMCKLQTLEKFYMQKPPDDVIIVTGQDKTGLFRNTDRIPWFEKVAR